MREVIKICPDNRTPDKYYNVALMKERVTKKSN